MRLSPITFAAVCLGVQFLTGGVQAQVVFPAPVVSSSASSRSELTSLSAEIDAIHAQLAELREYAAYDDMHSSGQHFCDCCYAPGWHAGGEVLILRPNFGGGILVQPEGGQVQPEFDYDASARVFLGYRGPAELGLRARYWRFDHTATPLIFLDEQTLNSSASALDVQALDLEITKVLFTSGVHWDLGAGIRYARVESVQSSQLDLPPPNLDFFALESVEFEGLGPTFSVEGRHQIGNTTVSLIGNLRASLLHGDQKGLRQIEIGEDLTQSFPGVFNNKVIPILETQFGIEWGLPLRNGRLFFRAMLEGQWWGDAVTSGSPNERELLEGLTELRTENLGLFGGSVSAAYVW